MSKLSPTQQLVHSMYRDQKGDPVLLSPSQDDIFKSIAMKQNSRVHIMCHTRFGKSLTVALAALTRASTYPEKWAIISHTKPKAKIIMDYIIQHIYDNEYTESKFILGKGETKQDIRRYRNKNRLNFKVGVGEDPQTGKEMDLFGELFVGSAKDALGYGAENVIEDEAAIIPDPDHSMVMRMLGDDPFNNFMCKIGNPFNRNHFLKSYHDPKYVKHVIDCYQSLKEGRITQETIDENRPYPFFDVLYECKFPSASKVDESGWLYLVTDHQIKDSMARTTVEPSGEPKLGHDVARGGRNYNAWVLRQGNHARVIDKDLESNLTVTGDKTINLMREYGVKPYNVFIDDSGVGGGEVDYLKSKKVFASPVNFGERAEEEGMLNVRSEVYAGKQGLMVWIKTGGHLVAHKDWVEATEIRYRKNATSKTQIESKDDMRKRGVESPDTIDALALTFAKVKKTKYYSNNNPKAVLDGNRSKAEVLGYDGLP